METKLSGSSEYSDQVYFEEFLDAAHTIASGSTPPPVGIIFFEADGTISSAKVSEDIDPTDSASISFAIDYVHHAFDRADWMLEYTTFIHKKKVDSERKNTPKLTLIKGGLCSDEE